MDASSTDGEGDAWTDIDDDEDGDDIEDIDDLLENLILPNKAKVEGNVELFDKLTKLGDIKRFRRFTKRRNGFIQ